MFGTEPLPPMVAEAHYCGQLTFSFFALHRGGPFKKKRELRGKLLERTFDELTMMKEGRKVRIPLALVDEVRLPPALVEAGDEF